MRYMLYLSMRRRLLFFSFLNFTVETSLCNPNFRVFDADLHALKARDRSILNATLFLAASAWLSGCFKRA